MQKKEEILCWFIKHWWEEKLPIFIWHFNNRMPTQMSKKFESNDWEKHIVYLKIMVFMKGIVFFSCLEMGLRDVLKMMITFNTF
jgi:hypothetical protein